MIVWSLIIIEFCFIKLISLYNINFREHISTFGFVYVRGQYIVYLCPQKIIRARPGILYIPAIISFSITGSKKCPAEIIAFKGRPGSTKHSGLVWPMYCKRSLRLSKSSAASSKLGKTLACRCLKNLEKK